MTTVEVVVPTYARPEGLRRTLEGLARQRFSQFVVAVVDDSSPIPAAETLRGAAFPFALRHLRTATNGGPAAARNLAVRTSNADLIVFVDDDVVPDAGLVEGHIAAQAYGSGNVTIGPLRAPHDWRPTPWNRWEAATLDVEYQRMARGEYRPTWRQFFTGNASVWRADFLAVGGFDESFARAEDIEFAYRLARRGAQFAFLPEAVGWHYASRSLASWRRIPAQYAEFDLEIDRIHPELHWDRLVRHEAGRRHAATRFVQRASAKAGAERVAVSCSISAARVAHALRRYAVSNRLLSVAFQLEYGRSRRAALRERAFNSPSTVPH